MEEPTSTEFSDLEEAKVAEAQAPVQPNTKINSSFLQRTKSTILMLGGFALVLSAGQLYCALTVLVCNFIVFRELNNIKRS